MSDSPVKLGQALTSKASEQEQVKITNYSSFWNTIDSGYGHPWQYVARINNEEARFVYADVVSKACNNPFIQYSMNNRYELYNYIKANGLIDPANINVVLHCDCSSFAQAMLLYIGIDLGTPTNTAGMLSYFTAHLDLFTILDSNDVLLGCQQLLVGDILWFPAGTWNVQDQVWVKGVGHAAVVVYSEYDKNALEYVEAVDKARRQGYGRVTSDGEYVCDGSERSNPDSAPVDLCGLSDLELFIIGAYITGGPAVTRPHGHSDKTINNT